MPQTFAPRSLLAVLLLTGAPVILSAVAPATAQAQSALFAEPLIELLPGTEAVGDGVTPVQLYLLALDRAGAPLTGLSGKMTPTDGTVDGLEEVSPGLYRISWTPPQVTTAHQVSLNFRGRTASKENVTRRWDLDVSPPLTRNIAVTANPTQVVLGQDPSATLTFTLAGGSTQPLQGSDLVVRSSAGTVSNLTHLGGGQYSAMFTPPAKPFPHVAVITIADRRNPSGIYGTFALPLVGKASFPVTSAPNSRVIVRIGDRDFGPVQADASGRASVAIVVPPGDGQATLISVLGEERTESALDLQLPSTPRLSLLPMSSSVPASPSAAVPVRVAVTHTDGSIDIGAQVQFTTTAGQISEARHEGGGVYVATFTPPYSNAASQVTIQVAVTDARGAQTDSMTLDLIPARPAAVTLSAEPPQLTQGAGSFVLFTKVVGQDGVGISGREVSFTASGANLSGGTRDLGNGDYQSRFATSGSTNVEVLASAQGTASANPLAQVVILSADAQTVSDGTASTALTVLSLDSFGYPVPNTTVALTLEGDGSLPSSVTTDAHGFAQVHYTAGRGAGLIRIHATSGDHSSATSLLQLPASAPQSVTTIPLSGTAADQALVESWRSALPSLLIEREGAVGALTAAVETSRTGPLSQLSVTPEPSSAAPGGTVTLTVRATDAAGRGKSGLNLDFIPSSGTLGAVADQGDGTYQVPVVVPTDATGEIKVTVASADGSVVRLVKIPVTAPASVAVWGASTATAEPAAAEPAAAEPVAAEPVAAEPAAAPIATTSPSAAIERPWLRLQAGYQGGVYSYKQSPDDSVDGPLYENTIAFGGGTTDPAASAGLTIKGRAFVPSMTFIGAELGYSAGQYSVALPEFDEAIPDWLHDFNLAAIGRYPFDVGNSTLHIGGRLGFELDDFMLYRQTIENGQEFLSYEPLFIPGLQLGAEINAEIGERFFGLAVLDLGLANGSSFYRTDMSLSLGYAILDALYAHAGLGTISRNTTLYNSSSTEIGTLRDGFTGFNVGLGYQL